MGIIPLDKTLAPYKFEIYLSNKIYTLQIDYNVTFDFYTIDLNYNDELLVKGEKLVLNQPLFLEACQDADLNLNPNFPAEVLFMGTQDSSIKRISYDNLGTTVQLYYVERSELQ
jgi:hypothetical protein